MTVELVLSDKEQRRFWSKVALPDGDGCMLWAAAINGRGYGHSKLAGRFLTSHRVSLHLAVGAPASADLQIAHSCRNRHCVAPAHLRWATAAENTADKFRDGTVLQGERQPHAILTNAQAVEIRQSYAAGAARVELRERYGINRKVLSALLSGRTYQSAGA